MAPRRAWTDFTPGQRGAILALAAMEMALTTIALVDLARRPATLVRGPKPFWIVGCIVQPIGPMAYLTFGRRDRRP